MLPQASVSKQGKYYCKAIYMEMIFYSHDIKLTHFHKKGFALSLILKVTVFGTRKWPIKNLYTSVLSH